MGGEGDRGRAGNFPIGPVSLPPEGRPWAPGPRALCCLCGLSVTGGCHAGWDGSVTVPHQHEVWMKRQEAPVPEARPRPGTRKCSRVKAPRWWGVGPVHPGPGG